MRRVHSSAPSVWGSGSAAVTIVLPPASPTSGGLGWHRRSSLVFPPETPTKPNSQRINMPRTASMFCSSATGWEATAPSAASTNRDINDKCPAEPAVKEQQQAASCSKHSSAPPEPFKSSCAVDEDVASCFTETAASEQLEAQQLLAPATSLHMRPYNSCAANPPSSSAAASALPTSTSTSTEWLGAALARLSPQPRPRGGSNKRGADQLNESTPAAAVNDQCGTGVGFGRLRRVRRVLRDLDRLAEECDADMVCRC